MALRIVRIAGVAWSILGAAAVAAADLATYSGACDASAAVALDARHFVVANDEHNVLGVYRLGTPAAVASVPLDRFLGTRTGTESDIEGAAMIGSRIYWISSHARDARGRAEPARQRLFATDIVAGATPSVVPAGWPYTQLLEDLVGAPELAPYALGAAAGRAPEAQGGLNIEGLAATPDGRLLIGLRNPLVGGRALLVTLENPEEVVLHRRRARLGTPIELDLGGRGIRSIELVAGRYLIAAGPIADAGSFAVYRWSGRAHDAPERIDGLALGDLRPEALFEIQGSRQVVLLSDDGGLKAGQGRRCKDLPAANQSFRALTFTP